jgi:hypothetical protein
MKSEGGKGLGRDLRVYEDNNKMDFKEIECEGQNRLNWITLSVLNTCLKR